VGYSARAITAEPALLHQVEAKFTKAKPGPVIAELRPEEHPEPDGAGGFFGTHRPAGKELEIQQRRHYREKFWKQYMKAYETCLSATSTRNAPWYVVPADDKENARLIVSKIVLDTLEGLEMTYPRTSAKRRRELLSIRKQLMK
jgi:Polyphosphate kinase 2 (PPK2)